MIRSNGFFGSDPDPAGIWIVAIRQCLVDLVFNQVRCGFQLHVPELLYNVISLGLCSLQAFLGIVSGLLVLSLGKKVYAGSTRCYKYIFRIFLFPVATLAISRL